MSEYEQSEFGTSAAQTGLPSGVDELGEIRYLACLPPDPDFSGLPKFKAAYSSIPTEKWEEIEFAAADDIPVSNQGRYGSCTWHAEWFAFTLAYYIETGKIIDFSPTFGYALGNGGRDGGLGIGPAIRIAQKYGNCLASQFPEGHIWAQDIPKEAYETGKLYRIGEAYHAESFEDICIGEQLGFTSMYAVCVDPATYGRLDEGGVSPILSGQPNHAQAGRGLIKVREGRHKGEWGIPNRNSWDIRWGKRGENVLVKGHFMGAYSDAWLIKYTSVVFTDDIRPPHSNVA